TPAERRPAAARDQRPAGRPHGAARGPDRKGHARRHCIPGDPQMSMKKVLLILSVVLLPVGLAGEARVGVAPSELFKPLGASWPTYSGDYSGKRYSSLTQINRESVKRLGLAWVKRLTAGAGSQGGGFRFGGGPPV